MAFLVGSSDQPKATIHRCAHRRVRLTGIQAQKGQLGRGGLCTWLGGLFDFSDTWARPESRAPESSRASIQPSRSESPIEVAAPTPTNHLLYLAMLRPRRHRSCGSIGPLGRQRTCWLSPAFGQVRDGPVPRTLEHVTGSGSQSPTTRLGQYRLFQSRGVITTVLPQVNIVSQPQ